MIKVLLGAVFSLVVALPGFACDIAEPDEDAPEKVKKKFYRTHIEMDGDWHKRSEIYGPDKVLCRCANKLLYLPDKLKRKINFRENHVFGFDEKGMWEDFDMYYHPCYFAKKRLLLQDPWKEEEE